MKKNNKNRKEDARRNALQARSRKTKLTVGIDLGDEWSQCCFLDDQGEIVEECRVKTTPEAESPVRGAEASVDGHRGGGAFALGESTVERVGARGDRGQDHHSKLCADDRGQEALRQESGCGPVPGVGPRRSQSSESDPELRITKAGDCFLRSLLVECAQKILTEKAPDTALKQFGKRIEARGKKKAKKRAIVAVARKLAVLLHKLRVTGEVYEPFPGARERKAA